MTFRPSLHGWAFEDDHALDAPHAGLGAAPPLLGLGGGMCWTALDRYLDGRGIPDLTTAPAPGSPLHAELRARQVAALQRVWPRVRAWQALPDGSWRDRLPVPLSPGRGDLASLSRREWGTIRRSLKAGTPILLTLLEHDDAYARGTAARQVLACEATSDATTIVLALYDPARPGSDDLRLAFSLRGPLDARLTGGNRIRGFFAVPYDRAPAPALLAESFAAKAVLGLNRKIRGRPGAVAVGRALHIVARDHEGALLHFQRGAGRRHWESVNVTEREEITGFEIHTDPVAHPGPGGFGLHAFSRSYVGDLIHFRRARRWTVANRTENRRAGPRFRLEGDPVTASLPWGGVCIVGRGKEGSLVAYSGIPFRGWRAEEVPAAGGGKIHGDPVAVGLGPTVQVIGRTRDGRILHFERTSGGWSAGDLTTLCPGAERCAGACVLLVHDGRAHVFARTGDDRLLHLHRDDDGQWTAAVVAEGIAGDPAATVGPAGLHVFATGSGGGLMHAWLGVSGWRSEDIAGTRPASVAGTLPADGLVAWGSSDELRVVGNRDGYLVAWGWRADADWTGSLTGDRAGFGGEHEPDGGVHLVRDAAGRPHWFGTDGSGTIVHIETGAWRAPDGRVPATREARAVRRSTPPAVARPAAKSGGGKAGKAATEPVAAPLAADDLPLLEDEGGPPVGAPAETAPEVEGPGSEASEPEASEAAKPDMEPLDLDELGSWPPKAKGPASKPAEAPPGMPPVVWPE